MKKLKIDWFVPIMVFVLLFAISDTFTHANLLGKTYNWAAKKYDMRVYNSIMDNPKDQDVTVSPLYYSKYRIRTIHGKAHKSKNPNDVQWPTSKPAYIISDVK